MEDHAVAWETAAVTSTAGEFELTVRLSGQPSVEWEALFSQATERWGLSSNTSGWGQVRLENGTICMGQLRPDAREVARRYLDDLVSSTNAGLAAKREQEEQERLRREQEEAELKRTADELAAWFRSATGAPRPAEGNSPEAAAEASGEADLRDRLTHAFRTDVA